MKKTIFISIILATSLHSKANMKLVDKYVEVSGIKEIITALPKRIKKGYMQNNKKFENINMQNFFEFASTMNYVKMKLSDELSNTVLKQNIAFYKTPLGKKFKNNGLISVSKSNILKKEEFYEILEKYPPSYKRLAIINNFIDNLELSPMAAHIIAELLGDINAKMLKTNNPTKLMKNSSQEIKDYLYQNALYAYGDFSQKELNDMIKYFNTTAGKFERMVTSRIFKQLISDAFSQIKITTF